MNILPLIKVAANMTTSLGAGMVVGNVLKGTTPTNMKTASKVLVTIGTITLSSIAGEVAGGYVERSIQEVADSWKAMMAGKAAVDNLFATVNTDTTES